MLSKEPRTLVLAKFRDARIQTVDRQIQEGLVKFSIVRGPVAGRLIQGGSGKFSIVRGLVVVRVTPVGFHLVDESDFIYLVAIV